MLKDEMIVFCFFLNDKEMEGYITTYKMEDFPTALSPTKRSLRV
jgi:hypothetical protein